MVGEGRESRLWKCQKLRNKRKEKALRPVHGMVTSPVQLQLGYVGGWDGKTMGCTA